MNPNTNFHTKFQLKHETKELDTVVFNYYDYQWE